MTTTINSSKAQLTSIFVEGEQIESPATTFLAKKINNFVQSDFFKNAAGSKTKGTYRLVKTGDTLTLEKKQADNTWKQIKPPVPNPADADAVSSSSSDDNSTDTPTDNAEVIETLKGVIGHFEHAAQKTVRSKFSNNSCFLDAPYALLANIPSLRATVLNAQNLPDTAKRLADTSSIKNGNDIRACFRENAKIQDQNGGDPCELLAVLTRNTSLAQIDVDYPPGQTEISEEELDRLAPTDKSTVTSIQNGYSHKHLALTTTTTVGDYIAFEDLLTQFETQKKIDIPVDSEGRGARDYKYQFKIDYAKPLWIEINRKKEDGSRDKDNRPLTNVPFELENDGNKLHLKGFIIHQGNTDSAGAHYVAYYRKLDIKTGEYQWWKDNDLEDSALVVNDDSIQETLKQATHLYYDNDFYEGTTDNDDAISVDSIDSTESFVSAIDE